MTGLRGKTGANVELMVGQGPPYAPRLILQGDICRRELSVGIDGFHA